MKIVYNSMSGKAKDCLIADAIRGTIDQAGYDGGTLERVTDRSSKAAEILGQLVQFLHENNHLTNDQVAAMLSYSYKVED